MLPTFDVLREQLHSVIANKAEQGHVTEGLDAELDTLPDSYDTLAGFASQLADLPLVSDWPYVEPSELDDIWNEADPERPLGAIATVDLDDSVRRVEAAFLGSVCGCVLGKPLEVRLTGEEIRAGLEQTGEWPLTQYVPERIRDVLARVHRSWPETVRERIAYVAPDDDINYTIMGMLVLEQFGIGFTQGDLRDLWLRHLPIMTTFGPERTTLLKAGVHSLKGSLTVTGGTPEEITSWSEAINPGEELCGALIRADAYGYACPGRPALAAELAWRDSHFTHRRTGIYGAMFVAAAIAAAQVVDDRMAIFETALRFVPQRSRFYERVSDCLAQVRSASDWEDGYNRIHARYGEYGHCRIYQEAGTLINTLRFAEDVGRGICIQVSQGADTDSFGATSGSLLGAYFGPGHLEQRWLDPLNDDIHSGMAWFFERSLAGLARRMGELPKRVAAELGAG